MSFTDLRARLGLVLFVLCAPTVAQESVDELVARGQELFHSDIGCRVCHADTGEDFRCVIADVDIAEAGIDLDPTDPQLAVNLKEWAQRQVGNTGGREC